MRSLVREIFLTEDDRRRRFVALLREGKVREAEDALHRMNRGTYVGDFVYGANDGIVTTFAVVAASAGAALSPGIVIILGVANLLADGFSMGASNFLSLRSEKEFAAMQRKREEWTVENFPEHEQAETRRVLQMWGIPEEEVEQLARIISSKKERWVKFMMQEDLGLSEEETAPPWKHGTATFTAFVVAGTLPILPYLFLANAGTQFMLASIMAGLAFFFVGAARTFITGANPLKAGLEILAIGGLAAVAAYVVGWAVKMGFGIDI